MKNPFLILCLSFICFPFSHLLYGYNSLKRSGLPQFSVSLLQFMQLTMLWLPSARSVPQAQWHCLNQDPKLSSYQQVLTLPPLFTPLVWQQRLFSPSPYSVVSLGSSPTSLDMFLCLLCGCLVSGILRTLSQIYLTSQSTHCLWVILSTSVALIIIKMLMILY